VLILAYGIHNLQIQIEYLFLNQTCVTFVLFEMFIFPTFIYHWLQWFVGRVKIINVLSYQVLISVLVNVDWNEFTFSECFGLVAAILS
jgi:hypothetical protein